jgi:hypothetical protein
MSKETKILLALVLAAGLIAFFMGLRTSEPAEAQLSVHAASGSSLSADEKQLCREVIQQVLALGWEDSHHDLAKALAIGRERLPEAQRAYEKSCEAAVEGMQ